MSFIIKGAAFEIIARPISAIIPLKITRIIGLARAVPTPILIKRDKIDTLLLWPSGLVTINHVRVPVTVTFIVISVGIDFSIRIISSRNIISSRGI